MGSWPSSENIRYIDDSYEIVDRKYQTYADVVKRKVPSLPHTHPPSYSNAAVNSNMPRNG